MKNREFYKEEILGFMVKADDFCEEFAVPKILESYGLNCGKVNCNYCETLRMLWLEEEHKEPEVDWTKVEVDTPILVSEDGGNWYKRYFARYENESVKSWDLGATSWTSNNKYAVTDWEYAKLAEKE
jgi:hypothetical protein